MLVRYTNTELLTLLMALTLTGLWGLAFTRRGWFWIKWLTEVEVLGGPAV